MKQKKKTDPRPLILKVDENLDKYLDKDLFKEKKEYAAKVLKTAGLPKAR